MATAQVLLEPLQGAQVQVVGRLVEEQEFGIREKQPGQRRAGLLAAGEIRRRAVPIDPIEPEARQRGLDTLIERVAVLDLELVLSRLVLRLGYTTFVLERPKSPFE